ncbi:uncharacterized protein METZ01_LOCUS465182, partial [marine metagenome]
VGGTAKAAAHTTDAPGGVGCKADITQGGVAGANHVDAHITPSLFLA